MDRRRMLDFLLTTKFDVTQGYSYVSLIGFLNTMSEHFKACYDTKERISREFYLKDRIIKEQDDTIKELQKRLENVKRENEILTSKISRKLTLKERLLGKIKW